VRLLYQQLEIHNKLLEQTVLERTAELRVSEERFHRLTELSSDWYWEQDARGQFTQVSGPALEMLKAGDAALEENIAARRPFLDLVYSRTTTDGSLQYFQVSGEPIFDPSGCYTGYRGVGMDVTARMRPATSQS
jgi:PAS domain-containing protein